MNSGTDRFKPKFGDANQDLIALYELVRKERRLQILKEVYKFDPRRIEYVAGKVTEEDPTLNTEIEEEDLKLIKSNFRSIPQERYGKTVLESHEIGWSTNLLIPPDQSDERFEHPIVSSDMTRFWNDPCTKWFMKLRESKAPP